MKSLQMTKSQENALKLSLYPLLDSKGTHYDGVLLDQNDKCTICESKECLTAKKLKDLELYLCPQQLLSLKITIFDEAYIVYGLKNNFSDLSKTEKKKFPNRLYLKDLVAIEKWKKKSNDIYSTYIIQNQEIEKNDSIFIHDIKKTFSTIYRKVEQYIRTICSNGDIEQCLKDKDPSLLGIYKAVSLIDYQFNIVDYIANPESVTYGHIKRIKVYKAVDKLVRIFQTTSKVSINLEGSSHNEIYLYDSFMTLVFVLLDNAIKYTLHTRTITVKINDYGGDVEISISSYSPYIPDENREKIFEKYYRENNTSIEGQGIGLYLAKLISESLQAPISVKALSQITKINDIDYAIMEFSFYVTNLE